eukprot:GILJ01003565.1.p1 GENE.GILJ01003565.1~~GILJ01003565.1.p1  ORF type:complete len:306 (-),score=33.44 GILJ01003565.1:115-1032(-)
MSIDIKLKRYDRIYRPGDLVSGVVVIGSDSQVKHEGIRVDIDGAVNVQLSARSVGLFEAFYSTVKPTELVRQTVDLVPPGRFPEGLTEYPFEFVLRPLSGQTLYETYNGVYITIQYQVRAESVIKAFLTTTLKKTVEIIVEIPNSGLEDGTTAASESAPVDFEITPTSLENLRTALMSGVPKFKIFGKLNSSVCSLTDPITGELVVRECDASIKSIEMQLVRVESVSFAEGFAKEATEIQNLQVAEGNVTRCIVIPLYMVLPRLFTCPTNTSARSFKIEFELNIIILFSDGQMITENFPIRLYRV